MRFGFRNWGIAVLTIVLGVVPLGMMSYWTGAFWPSSTHEFPFMSNLSVVIGDGVLLPGFNQCLLLGISGCRLRKRLTMRGWLILVGIAVMSTWAQYEIHQLWTRDQFTGFMDLELGRLSLAGWWHLVFSAVQTTLVVSFLTGLMSGELALVARKGTGYLVAAQGVLVLYLLLAGPELVAKRFGPMRAGAFSDYMGTEWVLILRLVFTTVWFVALSRRMRWFRSQTLS
jgi:hypothetical protein